MKIELDVNGLTAVIERHEKGGYTLRREGRAEIPLDLSYTGVALIKEVERLRAIVEEVHSWIVCSAIAAPEDMMQNAPQIIALTTPRATT